MDQANGLRSLMQEKRMKLLPEGMSLPVYVFARVHSISESNNTYIRVFTRNLVLEGKRVLFVRDRVSSQDPISRHELGWIEATFSTIEEKGWKSEDYSNFGLDAIVIDAGVGIAESNTNLHSEAFHTTLIAGGSEKDVLEAQGMARTLSRRLGVKKMNVIVQGLYDSKDAARLFTKIHDGAKRLCDAELRYSGSFSGTEKTHEKLNEERHRSVFLLNSS